MLHNSFVVLLIDQGIFPSGEGNGFGARGGFDVGEVGSILFFTRTVNTPPAHEVIVRAHPKLSVVGTDDTYLGTVIYVDYLTVVVLVTVDCPRFCYELLCC